MISLDTSSLTPAERRVAEAMAQGRTCKQVAIELDVSTRTVETHLRHISAKIGVGARALRRLGGEAAAC
jgi:DNA-binding CsgD family transcriptional regulator